MSNLFAELTRRNLANLGFENQVPGLDENELLSEQLAEIESIDTAVSETNVDLGEVDKQDAHIDEMISLEHNLSYLVMTTMEAYHQGGFNRYSAEAYQVAVRGIMRANHIADPVIDTIVPSFEAAEKDGGKAERVDSPEKATAKADGLLKRLWTMIADAFEALITNIGDIAKRMVTNASGLEKRADNMKAIAAKLTGDAKDNKVALAADGRYLCDKGGKFIGGSDQVHLLVAEFSKFSTNWGNAFDPLTSVGDVAGDTAAAKIDNAFAMAVGRSSVLKDLTSKGKAEFLPLPNHRLEINVKIGHEHYLTGHNSKMEFANPSSPKEGTVLSINQINDSLDSTKKAIEVYKKADTALKKLLKEAGDFVKQCRKLAQVTTAYRDPNGNDVQRTRFQAHASATSIVVSSKINTFGWTKVMQEYLQYVRANLAYTGKCMGKYSTAESK